MVQDAAGADIITLDVLMHDIHLGKAFDIYVFSVILTLGVITCAGTYRVPGILQPGLDLADGIGIRLQIVSHLFDCDTVIAG